MRTLAEPVLIAEASDPTFQMVYYGEQINAIPPFTVCTGLSTWSSKQEKISDVLLIRTRLEDISEYVATIDARRKMHEWLVTVPSMPDPLPDAPIKLHFSHISGILTPEVKLGIKHAVTRSRAFNLAFNSVLPPLLKFTEEANDFFDLDHSIVKPLHMITSIYDLLERAIRNKICVVFPYYTNYVHVVRRSQSYGAEFHLCVACCTTKYGDDKNTMASVV